MEQSAVANCSMREEAAILWHAVCSCDEVKRAQSLEDLVRKRTESLSFVAILAVVMAMVCFGSLLHAQNNKAPQQPPQTQQPQQAPDSQAPPAQSQSPDSQEPPARSQQQPDQQTPNQTQPSQDQAQQPDASGSKEFVGTVVKQGSKYVFQEAATGTTYDIDHQDEVKKFEGKKVRVHGTLDPATKMIHVQ
jgi:outer membrane biosynthesis protein TonB